MESMIQMHAKAWEMCEFLVIMKSSSNLHRKFPILLRMVLLNLAVEYKYKTEQ